MEKLAFPGQQSGEKILYLAIPHRAMMYIGFLKVLVLGFFVLIAIEALALFWSLAFLGIVGLLVAGLIMFVGIFALYSTHQGYETYITDRRIVRFTPTFPFGKRIRSIFWEEVAKTKTFRKNYLLEGILGIGSIEIHPKSNADKDNIQLNWLPYYEDLSNYIDKILYTYRSHPLELASLPPFIAKPRGQRG